MNKIKQIITISLIIGVVQWGLTSCGGSDDAAPASEKTKYEGTWYLDQATSNGFDITADFANLTFTVYRGNEEYHEFYTESDIGIFPIAAQRFQVSIANGSNIVFPLSGLSATMEVEGSQMDLSFVLANEQNAQLEGIEGEWRFIFSK